MSESLGEKIQRVLQEAPFAMRQLAADAGLSYDVLRSWRSGRRRPSRTSAARLAAGLQQRGELLLRLAEELREASGVDESGSQPRGAAGGTSGQEPEVRDRAAAGSGGAGEREQPEGGGPDRHGGAEGRGGGQWGQEPGRRTADDVVGRPDVGSGGWPAGRPPFDSSRGGAGQGGSPG